MEYTIEEIKEYLKKDAWIENERSVMNFENTKKVFYELTKLKAENKELKLKHAESVGHGNKSIIEIAQLKEKLKEVEGCLRDLLEMQNGAPLIRFEKEFNEIETKCWKLLTNK